jgi:hypothetical protein
MELDGKVELHFHPEGIEWILECLVARLGGQSQNVVSRHATSGSTEI